MTEPDTVDLVHLADASGDHCVLRVTGRFQPGVLTGHDTLRAELLAHASFVDVRLEFPLLRSDLDTWRQALTDLASGPDAHLGGDRGPSLALHLHEDGALAVTVHDPDCVTAMLWIRPQEGWQSEHLGRLEQVRQAWPSEVVETAPMTYAWRRNQHN